MTWSRKQEQQPDPQDDLKNTIQEMVEGGLVVLEVMKPVLETLEGYKKEVARYGYNDEQQLQMAADLHYMITHSIGNNKPNG